MAVLVGTLFLPGCFNYVYDMNREADEAITAGNYGQALGAYDRAINLNPRDAEAYMGRGYVHQRLGNYHGAIADFSRAIELMPNNATPFFLRGMAYSMSGDNERAVKDYWQSIARDPGNSDVYFNLAESYNALGDRGKALENYRKAAKLGNADAQNALKQQGFGW